MGKFGWVVWVLVWGLGVWLVGQLPAIAAMHTYPDGAGQVMVRSLQTLRDDRDRAWQLVLFKRKHMALETIHLRLVGFPGRVQIQHPAPLQVLNFARAWAADDQVSTQAVARCNAVEASQTGYPEASFAHRSCSERSDESDSTLLPANVGEYDVRAVMHELTANAPLHLVIALEDGPSEVTVPPFVVREWRMVSQAETTRSQD